MENKGVSKALWIIAIVLVIFLIGGIVVLIAPTVPAEEKGTLVVKAVEKGNESNIIEDATIEVTRGGSEVFTVEGSGSEDLDPDNYCVDFESKTPSGWELCTDSTFDSHVKAGETTTAKGYYEKSKGKLVVKAVEKGNESNVIGDATIKVTQDGSEVFTVEGGGSEELEPEQYCVTFELETPSGWELSSQSKKLQEVKAGETTTAKGLYKKPEEAPSGVTVTTGEVTDHNLITSIKVTLEGEKDSYSLSMTGPEGTEVGSAFITKTQMADGKQSVWVALVEDFMGRVTAKPGAYSLVVTDFFGNNKVYEKTFDPYSGSDLSVINISTISTSHGYGGYSIESIPLTVKNDGDLPAYVTGVDVTIGAKTNHFTISEEEEVILPGETATITASPFIAPGPFDKGDYSASFKLKEGFMGQGKTVATCTTTISIP